MGKKVTRDDVAKLAGVSPAVVSYVINQTKTVSEEKTIAVKKAIEELHYRPNVYARSLKTNKSMQIAFVCDNLRNDWLEIAEKMFFDKGYFVSHCYSRDGADFIQMLIEGRFDGVFMLSNRYTASQLNEIARAGIPIVLYKTRDYSYLEPNIVTVAPDIYGGILKTVSYLIVRGHKKIILAPPLRYNMNLRKGYRERAYREALEENGLVYDEALVCRNTDSMEAIFASIFDLIFGGKPSERPTAIVAGDDYLAGRIIQYLKKMGLRVPEDMAVVGMDNTYLSEMLSPQLSSVNFSKEEFSERLVDTMLGLIQGKQPADQLVKISLSVREST
ncbi:MAG: LacI family DNA-binding transcriptional regulator [Lachnospiraceae bacterium]|nr:LacI family DNA-binding transcriptional regulator [Lachnospiraceae bacterium]